MDVGGVSDTEERRSVLGGFEFDLNYIIYHDLPDECRSPALI